jgi:hypothetical protein
VLLVPALLFLSTPAFPAETLVADGKVVTYERLPDTDTPAVGFQMDSKGYRNIYLLDCQNRRFLWVKNINLSTGRETNRAANAEWKPMNARSTVTNAVYQASCPGAGRTTSEFSFHRAQGTQGAWSWDGPRAITFFPSLDIKMGVLFLPDESCDEALFYIQANQKLPSLGFTIDGRSFGYVKPEFVEGQGTIDSVFSLSRSGLSALKRGYRLILDSNLGSLNVSLSGSSASFTQAYNNCMALHRGEKLAENAISVNLADVLIPLEGWWGLDDPLGCRDEDGQYRIFLGRLAWNDDGTPYISKNELFRIAFYEGNCVFTKAKQLGNKIQLDSLCDSEGEKYSGTTTIEVINPDTLSVNIANWGGFSTLFRCGPEKSSHRFEVQPIDQEPRVGRCHMDNCSWFRVYSQEEIQSQGSSTLVNVTLLGGDSANDWDNGDPPVTWNDDVHQISVFCSTELPAVFSNNDGSAQTTAFYFWNGTAGYQESAATFAAGFATRIRPV